MGFFENLLCFTLHNRSYPFVSPPKLAVPPYPTMDTGRSVERALTFLFPLLHAKTYLKI
jgi:hypothetical protein